MSKSILQIVPSWEEGGQRAAFFAITAEKAGFESFVFYGVGKVPHPLLRGKIKLIPLYQEGRQKNFVSVKDIEKMLDAVISEHTIDLVHIHQSAWGSSIIKLCQSRSVPWVIDCSKKDEKKFMASSLMSRGWKKKWQHSLAMASYITHETGVSMQHILKGDDQKHVKHIPYAIDLSVYDSSEVAPGRIITLNQDWSIQDGVSVVLMVGTIDKKNNYKTMIKTVEKLKKHSFLCMVLNEPYQENAVQIEKIQSLVIRKNMEAYVGFIDQCSDLPAAFMLADVILIANSYENVPYIYLQAQAMGRPIVLGKNILVEEMINVKATPYYFNGGDPQSLATVMMQALGMSAEERETYSKKTRHYIKENFNQVKITRIMSEFYHLIFETEKNG